MIVLGFLLGVGLSFGVFHFWFDRRVQQLDYIIERFSKGDYKTPLHREKKCFKSTQRALRKLSDVYAATFEEMVIAALKTSKLSSVLHRFATANEERTLELKEDFSAVLFEVQATLQEMASIKEAFAHTQEALNALNSYMASTRNATDAGRGFSVVADEIRKLSLETDDSLGHINRQVEQFVTHIEGATTAQVARVEHADKLCGAIYEDIDQLLASADNLKELSDDFYHFVSEKSIDVILKAQLANLVKSVDKCVDVEGCRTLSKALNISNFQVLDATGKVVLATEDASIGLNLFAICHGYQHLYEGKLKSNCYFTPIVTRLDGFYAKFCAQKYGNRVVVVEYAFGINSNS